MTLDSSLPELQWAAPRIRAYVASRIQVCLGTFLNVPEARTLADEFLSPAGGGSHEYFGNRDPKPSIRCDTAGWDRGLHQLPNLAARRWTGAIRLTVRTTHRPLHRTSPSPESIGKSVRGLDAPSGQVLRQPGKRPSPRVGGVLGVVTGTGIAVKSVLAGGIAHHLGWHV